MAAIIIKGEEAARKIRDEAARRAEVLKQKGIMPCLAVILPGDNPASVSYVKGKKKALAEAGMECRVIHLPAETPEKDLLSEVEKLNSDRTIHGILVQHPFPPHINEERVFTAVIPEKDVDGFHPVSSGNLMLGRPGFVPGTPLGIIYLLKEFNIPVAGKHVVIINRSNIVGKPLAILLVRKSQNATVTICHTGTQDLGYFTRQADILIAAVGRPGLVTRDMVKEGAAVIDVGVNRIPDSSKKNGFRLVGDADFDGLLDKAGWITAVPGGVGPMSIAMVMRNLADAAAKTHSDV